MNLIKKTAIVTGGAQGIGLCVSLHLAEMGYGVVAADIDEEAIKECEDKFIKNRDILFMHLDVSDEDSVKACVNRTMDSFARIDSLINNAAISNPQRKPVTELSLKEWNRVISVNLTGIFLMSKHCATFLSEARGSIVNIASTRAIQSEPDTEAYSASKGGVLSLTHAMAISFSDRIRVNCISPGWIEVGDMQKKNNKVIPRHSLMDEKQHPAGRVGRPEDIAELVSFLISDSSGFITGQNFVVDGGMTKKMTYV